MGEGYGCSYCHFTYSSQPLPAIVFIQLHSTAGKIHSRLDKERFLGRAGTISLLTF